jgi:hypothetical protein
MLSDAFFKPSCDEWLQWAQIVISRLTTCVHVYSKPPFDDVFMPEKDRQDKNAHTLQLLRRIYALTDESDTPSDTLTDVAHHDERVISGLAVLFEETLEMLPELSQDMQKLMKSGWYDNCSSRTASELFRGSGDNEAEGIGSGYPEHRRLPLALKNMLERESMGDSRAPRQSLHRHGHEPERGDDEGDLMRRWVSKNGSNIRSGRIE